MTAAGATFDILLAGAILFAASRALFARDGFETVAAFIVFGLFVALAWARLGAPDVALAEAAVGSGLTGAMVLSTFRHLAARPARLARPAPAPGAWTAVAAVFCAVVTGVLALAVLLVPRAEPLAPVVTEHLGRSGVENPVTAVLLNFRAFDTLLESAVVFAALIGVWVVGREGRPVMRTANEPLVLGFARVTLPALFLVAGFLLWLGTFAPGGAFQAAAMLAGAGVVVLSTGLVRPRAGDRAWIRPAVAAGLGGFLLAAVLTLAATGTLLAYPPGEAKTWILAIEAGLAASMGVTLAALFHGAAPATAAPRGGRG